MEVLKFTFKCVTRFFATDMNILGYSISLMEIMVYGILVSILLTFLYRMF